MTLASKGPPPWHGGDPLECQLLAGVDTSETKPPRQNNQGHSQDPAELTCASMRAAELRDCLVREIIRAAAIGMQAQAALLDGDDEAAIGHLRRHWVAMRADIAPLASELGLLKETRS